MEKNLRRASVLCLVFAAVLYFVFEGMRFSALLFVCAAMVLALLAWLAVRKKRTLMRMLCALLALGFVFFAFLEAQVIRGANGEYSEDVDAVIVLGAGVNGERPSLSLRTRIDAAAAYIYALPNDVPVILSGGQGGGEDISEAECMRRELKKFGFDDARLILEDKSTDTRENLVNSCEILREMGLDPNDARLRVAIVTNDFHLHRAQLLWEEIAAAQTIGVGAKLPWLHLIVNYYVREAFALAELLVLGG